MHIITSLHLQKEIYMKTNKTSKPAKQNNSKVRLLKKIN